MMPPGIPENPKHPIRITVSFARYADDPSKFCLSYDVLRIGPDNLADYLKGIGGGQNLTWY